MLAPTILFDSDIIEERLRIMVNNYQRLKSYSERYHQLKEEAANGNFPKSISVQVAEKAIDAERCARILLKEGLDTLNEWVDSGLMASSIRQATEAFSSGNILEKAEEELEFTKETLKERYPDIDWGFLDEGLQLLKQHQTQIKVNEGKLFVSIKGSDGQSREFLIEPEPRPGQTGRISSREFFHPDRRDGVVLTRIAPAVIESGQAIPLDIYGTLIGGFSFTKHLMYQRVRHLNEIGLSRFTGNDPVTALAIGFWAVALAALIMTELGGPDWWYVIAAILTGGMTIFWDLLNSARHPGEDIFAWMSDAFDIPA